VHLAQGAVLRLEFHQVVKAVGQVAYACRAAEGKPELSLKELIEEELIRYIPFPDALKGKYQSFTQADITKLREAGYKEEFLDVKAGVERYVKWMLENLA